MSNDKIVTHEELQAQIDDLKRPIAFDDLASRGIMVKEGSWYRVLKFKELPVYVWKQVQETADDRTGKPKVRFHRGVKRVAITPNTKTQDEP